MKFVVSATLLVASAINCAAVAQSSSEGFRDSNANELCWDVLNNVAREKTQGAGRLKATGDYAKTQSGSSEDKKVQGPGAEPKDATGVTVGQGNASERKSESGASIRPSGIPNC
jgi:hypothetical protein